MSMFIVNSKRPLHLQLAERIKTLIAQGYAPGDTLPTYRDLVKRFNVGLVSVKRAMDVLAAQGIVSPIRSKGTIVRRRLEPGETHLSQVALVVRSSIRRLFEAPWLNEIVGSLCGELDRRKSNVRIFSVHTPGEGITAAEVVETGADGVVLLAIVDESILADFAAQDVPLVALDHHCPTVAIDYLVCDNAGAAKAVVDHLAGLGHRRIAYAEYFAPRSLKTGTVAVESDAEERRNGVARAAQEAGMELRRPFYTRRVHEGYSGSAFVQDLAKVVGRGPDAPTALVGDDEAAAAECIARLREMGFRVPEDISVAAVAAAGGDRAGAGITCASMDFAGMGRQAMDVLELRSRTPRPAEANVARIGFRLIVGGTTAAPPRR